MSCLLKNCGLPGLPSTLTTKIDCVILVNLKYKRNKTEIDNNDLNKKGKGKKSGTL